MTGAAVTAPAAGAQRSTVRSAIIPAASDFVLRAQRPTALPAGSAFEPARAIVIDASVLVDVILNTPTGWRARSGLRACEHRLHLPDLAIPEVASVIRSLVRSNRLTPAEAENSLSILASFPARRWPMDFLMARSWELHQIITPYGAAYIALAEALGAAFLTADDRLARVAAPVARCPVLLV